MHCQCVNLSSKKPCAKKAVEGRAYCDFHAGFMEKKGINSVGEWNDAVMSGAMVPAVAKVSPKKRKSQKKSKKPTAPRKTPSKRKSASKRKSGSKRKSASKRKSGSKRVLPPRNASGKFVKA